MGEKVPGRVPGIPQEGNLGGAEAGHPNIPKDKTTSKQTEQRSLAKNHHKKRKLMTFARNSSNSGEV